MLTPRVSIARLRRAFTIVEMIVALLIMAALAAVMIPALTARMDAAAAAAVIDNIKQIRQAALAYRDNVGRYPKKLSQLTTKPAVGASDLCSVGLPQGGVDSWRGPYLAQNVTSAGLQTGGATILDDMDRSPASSTTSVPEGFMRLAIQDASAAVVNEVDLAFDVVASLSSGAVTQSGSTLYFWMAIRGC